MTTQQPIWKFVANLGDRHPLDHGGLFLYVDTTGVYPPELEQLEPLDEAGMPGKYEIYRMVLDPLKDQTVTDAETGATTTYLVPKGYSPLTYPHPVHVYQPWFTDELGDVATTMDYENGATGLRADLVSDDPLRLARAYRSIADYRGWNNFDESPLRLAKQDIRRRYKKGELE